MQHYLACSLYPGGKLCRISTFSVRLLLPLSRYLVFTLHSQRLYVIWGHYKSKYEPYLSAMQPLIGDPTVYPDMKMNCDNGLSDCESHTNSTKKRK